MNATIYVVQGSTGEYSDHREWMVRAYRSEDAAKAEVVRLSQAAQHFNALLEAHGLSYYDSAADQLRVVAGIDDPSFQHDYTGTLYAYYAVSLEDA